MELAVVLFFLMDILGFLPEPNTNGGRQLLCYSEAKHEQWKERKGSSNELNAKPKEDRKLTLNSVILKTPSPLQVPVDFLL
jgi:hypothetical protein